MKKMISSVLAALCLAAFVTACTPPPMPTTIISISNANQLANISSNMSGKYRLTQNIVVNNWLPLGVDSNPFTGELDGNGFSITINGFNSTENASATIAYYGLFGYIKGGKVHHLKVSSSSTLTKSTEKILHFGGIVGCLESGSVEQCIVDAPLSGTVGLGDFVCAVGGIVGNIFGNGTVTDCYTLGNVSSNKSSILSAGGAWAGGIAGSLFAGTVQRCYAVGAVNANAASATAYAGGILGFRGGLDLAEIQQCVALNTEVNAAGTAGAHEHRVVGGSGGSTASVNGCFGLDSIVTGPTPGYNGTGTPASGLAFSFFWTMSPVSWSQAIWDFSNISSTQYPKLRNTPQ